MQGGPYKNLGEIPVFQHLSDEQCAILGPALMALRLSAGAVLSTEGQVSGTVYVVVAGAVQAHASSGQRTRPVRGPGRVIGIESRPRTYSVSMQSEGAALCFPSCLVARLNLFEAMVHFSLAPALNDFSEDDISPPDLIVLSRMLTRRYYARGLDIGCGAGRLSAHLIARVRHVTMLDRNVDALKEAARIVGAASHGEAFDGVAADFHALPFHDLAFDLVVSRLAFHESNQPGRLLSEVFRIIAPGGHFALVDVVPPLSVAGQALFKRLEMAIDPHFFSPPSDVGWVELLSNAGFINVALRTIEISRPLVDRPGGERASAGCLEILRQASAEALSEIEYQQSDRDRPVPQLRWKDRRVVIVAERSG